MEATDEQQQDTERPPDRTIHHLPDEVLLEIFDSYRRGIDPYDRQWRKTHVWLHLTHVCRRWRAVVFASSSRLDVGITVGPQKPGHIKTILSSHLPILIDYKCFHVEITGSVLWRMRAALKHHHDRVREIAFEGTRANYDKLFKVTDRVFPALESLSLDSRFHHEPMLPDTFLRGPPADPPSDLHHHHHHHLRCLDVRHFSLASISEFLLSATALTDLTLLIDTAFGLSPETSLLACLQGMPYLRRLDVSIAFGPHEPQPARHSSSSNDIVPFSNLTCFRYAGHSLFLDALVAGISAPSLREVAIDFLFGIRQPVVHFPRFVDEIEERYHAVHVTFQLWDFRLLLLTQSEYVGRCEEPRFHLRRDMKNNYSQQSVMLMGGALSTRIATVEELRVTFCSTVADFGGNFIPWREFLRLFPSVKALRTERVGASSIARILPRNHEEESPADDDDPPFLPALEEIELGKNRFANDEIQRAHELVAFQPFVSARQQAGRPVKVFFSP